MDSHRDHQLTRRVFERWNWERDVGEGELTDTDGASSFAMALYDYFGRLVRVYVKNPSECYRISDDSEDETTENYCYDYFCDDSGRIVEKRSLDDDGGIFLIVRYNYDASRGVVTETAWSPESGSPPKSIERNISW